MRYLKNMDKNVFSNICRACLTEEGELKSMFLADENLGLTTHLAEMIGACASVQISLGDGLPQQICSECASKTVNMYLFSLKCQHSDSVLRDRLMKLQMSMYSLPAEHVETQFGISGESEKNRNYIKPELAAESDTSQSSVNHDFSSFERVDNKSDSEQVIVNKDHEDLQSTISIEYKCELCDNPFNDQLAYKEHLKSHDHVIEYPQGTTELVLRRKIAEAMKIDEQKIEISGSFDVEEPGTIYIKATDEVLYSCNCCEMIFLKQDELDAHEEIHEKKDNSISFSCKHCSKKFAKQTLLKRHLKTHLSVKPHVCETCKKSFARPEQLSNHMNAHSGIRPHTCEICYKGFNQISNLKDHLRTHNGEKPFLCSTCGKGFNQLGNLRQHTVRHTGIKAHLCSTCGSGFASKGELSAHLRKHTGARPFVCSVCNHGFTTSSSLTKHKRIHSGEKPYECDVCKMKFSRSGILARHKRIHTGEKPYICQFCSKGFSQSNDLTSHLRIHTGEKPFICDVCGQAFRQSSALKTHKKTHVDRSSLIDPRSIMSVIHPTIFSSIQ